MRVSIQLGRLTIYSILPFTRYGLMGLNEKIWGESTKYNKVNMNLFILGIICLVIKKVVEKEEANSAMEDIFLFLLETSRINLLGKPKVITI